MADNKPCWTASLGGVRLSAWKNRRGDEEWVSFKVSKSYKPKGASDWKNTDSLSPRDLLALPILVNKALTDLDATGPLRTFGPGFGAPAVSFSDGAPANQVGTSGDGASDEDIPF